MRIKAETWVYWIVATSTAALTMTSFAYSTFELKEHSKEVKEDIVSRLDRIEQKIDQIKR